MKTKILKIVFLCTILGATTAQAGDYTDGRVYIGVSGGVYALDSDRRTDGQTPFWGLNVGRFFTDNLSFDIEYTRVETNFTQAFIVENNLNGANGVYNNDDLTVMGRYHFGEDDGFRPYIAFGIGAFEHRHMFDERTDMSATLGIGLQSDFKKSGRLFSRFEIASRYVADDKSIPGVSSYTDTMFRASLNVKLGADPRIAQVVEVEAVVEDGDADGDGVPDSRDRCPNTPAGVAVDQYGCSLDSDGDGVPNTRDKCPDTRAGAVVDLDGCEVEAVIELKGVHFDFDRATLKPEAAAILDQAAALLADHERVMVEVAGHTDSVGSDSYNQGLSERRANTVRDYLMGKGISASRLTAAGYGEARPVATNDTKDGRHENRRVELVVLDR